MKKHVYYISIIVSLSLVFAGSKPCCNKNASKSAVTCKLNQVNISETKTIMDNLILDNSNINDKAFKCNSVENNPCNGNAKKNPWWKFWAKNTDKRCPCNPSPPTG